MGHMLNMKQLIPLLVFYMADWQRVERDQAHSTHAFFFFFFKTPPNKTEQTPSIDEFNSVSESEITDL